MVIAGRIQRYVFSEALQGLLLTLGVISLAILLVDMVEQMRTISSRTDVSILTAAQLTLYKTPSLLLETLPFATLVGAILTFSKLNRRSELPAMRAAGVSAWRFLGPAILLAGLVGVGMVTILDPLATRLQEQYVQERARLLNQSAPSEGQGVWLSQGDLASTGSEVDAEGSVVDENPDGQAIIHAKRVVGRAEALEGVTFYYFRAGPGGPDDRIFTHRIDAARAVLYPGFWQLDGGVVENRFGGEVRRQDTLALPTNLRPDTLLSRFASSKTIPFWDLSEFISANKRAGMDVEPYVLKYHTLLATPFLMVAMALIGAVVCLRLARSGGLTRLIGAGALSGFVLFFVTRVASKLSAGGLAPPEAAAWCPPLVALFTVLALLAHNEDG
ncbi:MAG: LPS export ABC transporter permease LptG [Hyphomonadaceae bacterium]